MARERTGVTVIATVLDEIGSLDRLLDGLEAQSRPPDEVVVVDGGSSDGTYERLLERAAEGALRLRVLRAEGANISRGRNLAIRAARGPILAATDAGVRLDPGWLDALVAPLEADAARVVSGFFFSDPQGVFETALGAATLPEAREIDPERFLPSSRSVAFLKEDALRIGGYPEWLDYCEDLVFDFRLLHAAGPAAFAPEALAGFRPRPHLRAFASQYYRYARGDGKADLWRARHAVRYATYLLAVPALLGLAVGRHPLWALGLAGGLAAMLRRSSLRLRSQWGPLGIAERARAAAWLPVIRVTGDAAKMLGYPAGWRWRLRERPPRWRPPGAEGLGRW